MNEDVEYGCEAPCLFVRVSCESLLKKARFFLPDKYVVGDCIP
jgi:hypothetical protein